MEIQVKFLGGMRLEMGMASTSISLSDGATVRELEARLKLLGLDIDSEGIVIALNDRGLRQWPPDREIEAGDVVLAMPYLGGGQAVMTQEEMR